ncbi:TetR family transcriptional regulator [Streptomyces sp. NPDC002088]|uniref:TetR family transcriptional regulator n=1 Tax=Streptomyces sp. NPDC002088 TaxID=3154665 RepID=UPI00331BDAA8
MICELNRVGWALLTVEGVAAKAGAGKASVYRRWPTKAALVTAALRHTAPGRVNCPDLGSLRDELVLLAGELEARVDSPHGRALRAALESCRGDHTQAFMDLFAEQMSQSAKNCAQDLVRRDTGRHRTGLTTDGDVVDMVMDTLLATLMYPLPRPDLAELVDRVVLPALYVC